MKRFAKKESCKQLTLIYKLKSVKNGHSNEILTRNNLLPLQNGSDMKKKGWLQESCTHSSISERCQANFKVYGRFERSFNQNSSKRDVMQKLQHAHPAAHPSTSYGRSSEHKSNKHKHKLVCFQALVHIRHPNA